MNYNLFTHASMTGFCAGMTGFCHVPRYGTMFKAVVARSVATKQSSDLTDADDEISVLYGYPIRISFFTWYSEFRKAKHMGKVPR